MLSAFTSTSNNEQAKLRRDLAVAVGTGDFADGVGGCPANRYLRIGRGINSSELAASIPRPN